MNSQTPEKELAPKRERAPYRSFTRKERLIPSLLLSLALPFTLLFFAPFEAYCSGIDQLNFSVGEFIWLSLLFAFLLAGALFAVLWNLKGRVFDVVFGVLFALSLLLFLQGTYLNFGINALPGDGVGVSSFTTVQTVVDILIWVLLFGGILAAVLFVRKWREIMRLVMTVAMIAVIGVQAMNFIVLSLTTDVMVPIQDRVDASVDGGEDNEQDSGAQNSGAQVLTTRNLTELSSEGNVILFVVDRFDYDFYEKMRRKEPDFFSSLDGFTFYDNNISKYARTYPAVASMLTGVENDFSSSRSSYFKKAYGSSSFLTTLKDNGYNINLYTSDYYGYEDASVLKGIADNTSLATGYRVLDRGALFGDVMRMALFRYLPAFAKGWVGSIGSDDANLHVEYDSEMPMYTTDMKAVFDAMSSDFTLQDDSKTFACIHIDGCHSPFKYDENWDPLAEDDPRKDDYSGAEIGMRTSFIIINHYIEEMKRLGVYEDATIIITGDHAAAYSDTVDLTGSRVTALMVKRKGAFGTPMTENSAPVSQDNLHATIFASEGITPEVDFGTPVFDVQEGDGGKRYYYFQKTVSDGKDEIVVYEVVGDAKDFDNWTLYDRIEVNGAIS